MGSGVVIGPDLVVTVGYLLIEAESVDLIDHQGRRIPGQVRAVDYASGLGLIRALVPLRLDSVPLGDSDALPASSTLWTLGQNEPAPTALALVSRKTFAGSWEYLLETPLMTLPAVNNWSGAGLFDTEGRLVGIGSLLVQNVYGDKLPLPGNLFVPVNLLKDPLPDLLQSGKRAGPATPWLGISSQPLPTGGLAVLRVSPDSPAAQAGIAVGDTLVAMQGQILEDLPNFYRLLRTLGPATAPAPEALATPPAPVLDPLPGTAATATAPAAAREVASFDGLPPPPPEEPWMAQLATLPQLVGLVGAPGRAGSAIFQVGSNAMTVSVGEQIGGSGWLLRAADADSAVIERGTDVRRIAIVSGG